MSDYVPVEETNLPRYCIFRGKKARVLAYLGRDRFEILGPGDYRYTVNRQQIRFI